jgi:hypothetical protein
LAIRPATLKTLIECKLEMDKSEIKKDFLEFVKYLEEMAIIHDEHCHVVEHRKTGDSGMKKRWQKQRRWQPQLLTQLWRKLIWTWQQ